MRSRIRLAAKKIFGRLKGKKAVARIAEMQPVGFRNAPGFKNKFPELSAFIDLESNFFPSLADFRIAVRDSEVSFHENGAPILIGDPAKDLRLVELSIELQKCRAIIVETLKGAPGFPVPRRAEERNKEIDAVCKFECELSHVKRMARGLLMEAVNRIGERFPAAGKKPRIFVYKKLSPVRTLRLFLSDEMSILPLLDSLRRKMVEIESLPDRVPKKKREQFLYKGGVVKLTHDPKNDYAVALACAKVFSLRNQIRKKMAQARLEKNPHVVGKLLDDMEGIENNLNKSKALVRKALLAAKFSPPKPIK